MASFCTSMHIGENVINDAHRLECFFCAHVSMWAPQRSRFWLKHFLMEMTCSKDGALACMLFDEFRGLNRKLCYWVWVRAAIDFPLKAKNVVQSIAFAKDAMELASFGTFVHQCVLSIERACFLDQSGRCVMLWHNQYCVCVFLTVK